MSQPTQNGIENRMTETIKYSCENCAFEIRFTPEQDKSVAFEPHDLYPDQFKCPDCGACLIRTDLNTQNNDIYRLMANVQKETFQNLKNNDTPITHNNEFSHCQRCKRPLKNPIYRKIGMGKICLGKSNLANKSDLLNQILTEEQKAREELKRQKLLEKQKTLDHL